MTDKLVVNDQDEGNYRYRLSWWLEEDQDIGGDLEDYVTSGLAAEMDPESLAAASAVKVLPTTKQDRRGFYWETKGNATAALRVAKAAMKNHENPMPTWATQAIAAGWKAPKGWKP